MSAKKPSRKDIETRIKKCESEKRRIMVELSQLDYEVLAKKTELARISHQLEKLNILKDYGEEY